MNRSEHIQRHKTLDRFLDELVTDYLKHNQRLLTEITVLELLVWSHKQMLNPTEVEK